MVLILFGAMVGFPFGYMQAGSLNEMINKFCKEQKLLKDCEDKEKDFEFYYRWKALIDWLVLLILFLCGLVAYEFGGCNFYTHEPYISPFQPRFEGASNLMYQQQPPAPYAPFMQQAVAPPLAVMIPQQPQQPPPNLQYNGYPNSPMVMPQLQLVPPYQPDQPLAPPNDIAGKLAKDPKTITIPVKEQENPAKQPQANPATGP